MNTLSNVQLAKTTVAANNDEYVADKLQRYLAWLEIIKTKKLSEYWEGLSFEIGESVGGYKQITIGNKDGVNNIAQFTIPALNALADLPKYDKPRYHLHESMFDPRKNQPNVRVAFDIAIARFQFFNWRNGAFSPSILNYPKRIAQYNDPNNARFNPKVYRDLNNKLQRMWQKHQMLDEMINVIEHGYKFSIILRNPADVSHFEKNIEPFINKPYSEYHQAWIERGAAAEAARDLDGVGDEQPVFSNKVAGVRSELVTGLMTETQPIEITFTTFSSKVPQVRIFDPAQPDNNVAPYISLAQISNAPGAYKFARKDVGKAAKESGGKKAQ